MKFLKIALLSAAMAATPAVMAQEAAPAAAEAGSALSVGATVMGNDGNPVGTIDAINGDVVVVNTGKHLAPIPANLIGTGEEGPSVNVTQAQLNEMLDAQLADAMAKRDAALVAGAEVFSANGNPAGTLESVDLAADAMVLESPAGKVALKKEHFALDGENRLLVLFTREQINTAAAAASDAGTGASN